MLKPLLLYPVLAALLCAQQRGNIDQSQIKASSKEGNGTKIQMFGGGTTGNGHVASYDAGGNVIDSGTPISGVGATQPPIIFPRYQAPIVPFGLSVTSAVTVANTITATSLIGAQYFGSATFPASYAVGRSMRIRAAGLYGSTATPTLTITVILGGVTLATITPSIQTAVSNDGWQLDYSFTVTSMTAVSGAGCFVDLGATAVIGGCASGATTGLDFTTAQSVDVQATWSAASASNTITAQVLTISPIT